MDENPEKIMQYVNTGEVSSGGIGTPPYLDEYVEVAIKKTPYHFETYFAKMDKHFAVSVAPWQGNGFATIFSDITDRKKAEEHIQHKNKDLLILSPWRFFQLLMKRFFCIRKLHNKNR
jgi:hypothetical protein